MNHSKNFLLLIGSLFAVAALAQTDSSSLQINPKHYRAQGEYLGTLTVLLYTDGCSCVRDKSLEFYHYVRDTLALDPAVSEHFNIDIYDFDPDFEIVDSLLNQGTDVFMPVIRLADPDGFFEFEMSYDLDRKQLSKTIETFGRIKE